MKIQRSWTSDYHAWLSALTQADFEVSFRKLNHKWQNFPKTIKRMQVLYGMKHKWAEPWVKMVFTAGCRSSQRGEGINQVVKKYFLRTAKTPVQQIIQKLTAFREAEDRITRFPQEPTRKPKHYKDNDNTTEKKQKII